MAGFRKRAALVRRAGRVALLVVLAASVPALAGERAGPEQLWLAQAGDATTEGNAGALEMQKLLEVQLRRIGVDYPAGQFMTMDQVNRLNSLFDMKEDEASTRDEARVILGM